MVCASVFIVVFICVMTAWWIHKVIFEISVARSFFVLFTFVLYCGVFLVIDCLRVNFFCVHYVVCGCDILLDGLALPCFEFT